jgi:phage protein D
MSARHSGPPNTITIRGKAADMRASIKAPKTRSWDSLTLGALVQTIAGEHGLTATISEQLALIAIEHPLYLCIPIIQLQLNRIRLITCLISNTKR